MLRLYQVTSTFKHTSFISNEVKESSLKKLERVHGVIIRVLRSSVGHSLAQ
jgi:hypothetical protein